MGILLNIILPILIGLFVLLVVVFLLRGLTARSKATSAAYEVGRQEARHVSQVNLIRALASLVIVGLLLAVVLIVPRVNQSSTQVIPTPELAPAASPTISAPATSESTPVLPSATIPPSPTEPAALPSPTVLPTDTPTPEPLTAVVTSGVGVWLRSEPGTESEQLEWLFEGTELIILPGNETVEELIWQEVQTLAGNSGWVAAEFIALNE